MRWPTLKGAPLLRCYYYLRCSGKSERFRVDLYTWMTIGGIGMILSQLEPMSKHWTQTYHRTMAPGALTEHIWNRSVERSLCLASHPHCPGDEAVFLVAVCWKTGAIGTRIAILRDELDLQASLLAGDDSGTMPKLFLVVSLRGDSGGWLRREIDSPERGPPLR